MSSTSKLNPEEEKLRLHLLAQIEVFKNRHWIDQTEENGFRSLLSSKKDDFQPSVKSLEAIKNRLKTIKKDKLKERSKARKDARFSKHETDSVTSASFCNGDNDQNLNDDRYKVFHRQDVINRLSIGTVDRLFTEMCVFARMGFLQPTSCLHCAFKQCQLCDNKKQKDGSVVARNKYCQNLVVWRRNANERISSENLDNNIFFVSCSCAQALIRNKTVQGLTWDKSSLKVIEKKQ